MCSVSVTGSCSTSSVIRMKGSDGFPYVVCFVIIGSRPYQDRDVASKVSRSARFG